MDTQFLKTLVDNGFGLCIGEAGVIVTAMNDNTNGGLDQQPATKIKLPISLQIRYLPNQNKRFIAPPPKNQRLFINNIQQKFDTMEEYRDYLYERYQEYYDDLMDRRNSYVDDRWDKHEELLNAQKEVEIEMEAKREEYRQSKKA